MRRLFTLVTIVTFLFIHPASAQNKTKIKKKGGTTCITSNGLPNHSTGEFPNAGNPNKISAQDHKYCFPSKPVRGTKAQEKRGIVGIGVNGIPMEPGTAEWYNNDRKSGWNYSAIGGSVDLGMDKNNAHVQPSGMYHYHGVPYGLIATLKSQTDVVGYAADGFPIHANYKHLQTSYRLKKGTRPSAPYGKYDGTFVQDWEYVEGSGDLDACNGVELHGKYFYVVTKDFPQLPRCMMGTEIDVSFQRKQNGHPHMHQYQEGQRGQHPPHQRRHHRRGDHPVHRDR